MFERSEIGLLLLQGNLESFLKIGITCASLQISGNIPIEMELLISSDRGSETISLAIFRILVGILQGLMLLLKSSEQFKSPISSALVRPTVKFSTFGVFR